MNTYETYVTGVTGRRLTIQAKNQKAAEIEALQEFTALVGAESNVEVIDITRTDGEDEDDWREDFWEVRVFASIPIEFTVTVKADDEGDAMEVAHDELDKLSTKNLLELDDDGPTAVIYESEDWDVLNIAESHGFENTPEDFKEAKRCAWNVKDES